MPDGGSVYITAENIMDIKGIKVIKVIKENTTHYLSGDYVKVSIRDE
jgi:hypothetical protein